MTEISVIVPVFNTEKYLSECLNSILNQSFNDFEIICINDGSTDNSQEILNDFKSKHDCIKIINQPNRGLAASRNVGLDNASGKYVLFIDSDDYFKKDAFKQLHNIAESKSLDLLLFKLINFDDESGETSVYSYFEMNFLKKAVKDEVFCWKQVEKKLFKISVTSPGKFFRRDLIGDARFPEGLVFEDNAFFFDVIFNARRIYFYDKYLYCRRLRNDSIISSYHDKFSDCVDIYGLIEKSLRQNGKYEILSTQFFNRKCRDLFLRFTMVGDEYKENFYIKIKNDFLKNKKALQQDGILSDCSKRSLEIYNSAINSQTYKEFELSVTLFDLNRKFDKLKSEYEKELYELKNSTSWKVTGIFRRITNRLKR